MPEMLFKQKSAWHWAAEKAQQVKALSSSLGDLSVTPDELTL